MIWIKFRGRRDLFLHFGYCPTCDKRDEAQQFYDKLLFDFNYYSRRGLAVSFSDFNSRLGLLTGDRSVAGDLIENKNKDLFIAFLQGIQGEVVNIEYAYGKYTNTHCRGKRGGRSIIDFCVVKKVDLERVIRFSVQSINFMSGAGGNSSGNSMAHNSVIKAELSISPIKVTQQRATLFPSYKKFEGCAGKFYDSVESCLPPLDRFKTKQPSQQFQYLLEAFQYAKKATLE